MTIQFKNRKEKKNHCKNIRSDSYRFLDNKAEQLLMGSCAVDGGCPSDYIAVALCSVSMILLLIRSLLPFLIHKVPHVKGSGFWLSAIQVFASFNLLVSIVVSLRFLKFERRHWWQSCYIWGGWIEGPLGFGLLLSCRIAQAYQLYFIFVKRRLPPIRTFVFLPLILLPWIAAATLIHTRRRLNVRCHMKALWIIPATCLHALYVIPLVGYTAAIRHIEFRFHEVKDLWWGILVAAASVAIWVAAYILNEIHEDIAWLQVSSRFVLLTMTSVFVLIFFSISSSQPLLSQISLRKREPREVVTMGRALGIPDSGLLLERGPNPLVDPNEPLDTLLANKRFRQSFMAFADSCLAGENVHFYEEVQELGKIPLDDSVKRIYMTRYIIQEYIVAGAPMEVNISHQTRQGILCTTDLTHPNLFKDAIHELLQLMTMNLAKDYWSSMFFMKLKEEISMSQDGQELEHLEGRNFSPRLSSVKNSDDPFHPEHASKESTFDSHDPTLR